MEEPELIAVSIDDPGVTVIDYQEWVGAHHDPGWRRFCEQADRYAEALPGANPDVDDEA